MTTKRAPRVLTGESLLLLSRPTRCALPTTALLILGFSASLPAHARSFNASILCGYLHTLADAFSIEPAAASTPHLHRAEMAWRALRHVPTSPSAAWDVRMGHEGEFDRVVQECFLARIPTSTQEEPIAPLLNPVSLSEVQVVLSQWRELDISVRAARSQELLAAGRAASPRGRLRSAFQRLMCSVGALIPGSSRSP